MKATVVIECNKDLYFSCFTEESFDGFGLFGYGDTSKEAKEDLQSSYEYFKEEFAKEGREVPELTFTYKYDLSGIFSHFRVLDVRGVARKCGIRPSRMLQYSSGKAMCSEETYDRIRKALHTIGEELSNAVI